MKRQTARSKSAQSSPLAVLMKFRLVVNAVKRHFQWVERQCGINGAQLWALWEIKRTPGLRVSALARLLAMHQSSTSNLVDRLVRAGLVEKTRTGGDQRVVALTLAKKGAALLAKAPKPARGILAEALHELPPAALAQLDRSLGVLLKAMKPGSKTAMAEHLADILKS
jgi:MarR family transcriptional regulator, organic hydroperoxide resistance regulator